MLSRIADSLFWLNRYMERNDCLIRVIRTNYILSFDTDQSTDFSWKDVITLFSYTNAPATQYGDNVATALKYLIADTKNLNSGKVLVTKARENARGVQDYITKEVWEQVNQIYHIVNSPGIEERISGSNTMDIIDLLDQNSILFYGVIDSTMPRGQGWQFLNLGKHIERSLLTIDSIYAHSKKMNHQLDTPQDILFWKNLLLSLSGYELYLKTYTRGQYNLNVLEHVIFNKNFPRSLIYSLSRVRRYLKEVIEGTRIEENTKLEKQLGKICSKVEFADINTVKQEGLPQFLYSLRNDLTDFSKQLTQIYFSYA
ncbi:MAG TPA: alpha-E domain-containing protein [Chitinophagaceae bacterium]|nr:alpha-E domain-containing protein [Chitinophagaceae bacterium]